METGNKQYKINDGYAHAHARSATSSYLVPLS